MTVESPPTPGALLDDIATIAQDVDVEEAVRAVARLRAHRGEEKLRLLIVGVAGSGRGSLVNALLGGDILPVSAIPRSPTSVDVLEGPTASVLLSADGSRLRLPDGALRSFLLTKDVSPDVRIEVRTPAPLLQLCSLRIDDIDVARFEAEWRELLVATDYVVLVLNATALLSLRERQFLRRYLADGFGLERVALAVTQMDLVAEEEREGLLTLVRTFLGSFERQPAVLSLSSTVEGGIDDLYTLMHDLLDRPLPVRTAALRASLLTIVTIIEESATRKEVVFALEEDQVGRLKERLKSQRTWLEGRIDRAQSRVTATVETVLKERLLRAVEDFGDLFRRRLPEEVRSVNDLALVRRHLPGYIETVWAEFLRSQMIALRADLTADVDRINEIIVADLEEMLGHEAASDVGTDDTPDPHAYHVFVMPRRGKHKMVSVVRGLSLQGYVILWFAPMFGLASLAASQVVQRMFREEMTRADGDAIVASAENATRELQRQIEKRVVQQLDEISAQIRADIAAAYEEGVAGLAALLQERTAHRAGVEGERTAIRAILRRRIPDLRKRIGTLPDGRRGSN